MKTLVPAIERFVRDENGATAIEYGMLSALVAVGCIIAFTTLGSGLVNLFGTTDTGVGGAMADASEIVAGD